MKLSKKAAAIYENVSLPKTICKLIGCMMGTDMALTPGCRFNKVSDFKVFNLQYCGCLTHKFNCCAVNGISIKRFEVVRVTPCFAYIKLIQEHRLYRLVCRKSTLYNVKSFCFTVVNKQPRRGRYGISFCVNENIRPHMLEEIQQTTKIKSFTDLRYNNKEQEITINQSRCCSLRD